MNLYVPDLKRYLKESISADPRTAAEVAYALAILHEGTPEGERYVQMCMDLLELANIVTLEEAASRFTSINGVQIPSLFHEEIVRVRFNLP